MQVADILNKAREVVALEATSIAHLADFINDDFGKAVQEIHESKGRVVISGIGKSAIIAQKIVATMNSTGTPAIFMHAADAIHGDLGIVQPDDIVIIISKSGDTPEIKALVPLVKGFGNILIAICGNEQSYLSTHAHYLLNSTVSKEACPNNLAPTTSTTAQMVMGDALAVCLLYLKGFTARDFARFHPGGALGKRLYLTVGDLSIQNEKPQVDINTGLKDIILEISGKRLGVTAVLDGEALYGVITDGDLRRMLEKQIKVSAIKAKDICTIHPKVIEGASLAVNALEAMRKFNITQMLVTDKGKYVGVIHLHDLVREGII